MTTQTTDAAKQRAKEKRAKLKTIREQREAAQETAAIALLNDDAEALAAAKSVLQGCEAAEKNLTQVRGRWQLMPDGNWTREVEINDTFSVTALITKMDGHAEWLVARAILKQDGSDIVVADVVATTAQVEMAKQRLNAMIAGMRTIVREMTSAAPVKAPQS